MDFDFDDCRNLYLFIQHLSFGVQRSKWFKLQVSWTDHTAGWPDDDYFMGDADFLFLAVKDLIFLNTGYQNGGYYA